MFVLQIKGVEQRRAWRGDKKHRWRDGRMPRNISGEEDASNLPSLYPSFRLAGYCNGESRAAGPFFCARIKANRLEDAHTLARQNRDNLVCRESNKWIKHSNLIARSPRVLERVEIYELLGCRRRVTCK